MLDLRLGMTPETVMGYLRECSRELNAVEQAYSAFDALAAYQRWANAWARTFGTAVSAGDVVRLIASPRYWTLQSLASGHGALRELVELEVAERRGVLDRETTDLSASIDAWAGFKPAAAVVLDTSVILEQYGTLAELDWNALTGEQPKVNLILTIPLATIRELDNHKRSRTQAPRGGIAIRTQAQKALRTIGQWCPKGDETTRIQIGAVGRSDVFVTLLLDPLRHSPIVETDSEIIDRATSLAPFVDKVYVATYDRSMALGVRRAGLRAVEFEYDD